MPQSRAAPQRHENRNRRVGAVRSLPLGRHAVPVVPPGFTHILSIFRRGVVHQRRGEGFVTNPLTLTL